MELSKEQQIIAAAEKLVRCKGRYHSEQNYRALAALFGVTAPDLPLLEDEQQPVYQERRYQFVGKRQLEYWADVDRSTFQYLPKSERRIICIIGQED